MLALVGTALVNACMTKSWTGSAFVCNVMSMQADQMQDPAVMTRMVFSVTVDPE